MALFYNNLKLKMQKKDAFQRPNLQKIRLNLTNYNKKWEFPHLEYECQNQSKQKRKLTCFITYNSIIKHKTGLLNLSEELGNISQTYKIMGMGCEPFITINKQNKVELKPYLIKIDACLTWKIVLIRKLNKKWYNSP